MFLFTVACSGPDRDIRQDDSGDSYLPLIVAPGATPTSNSTIPATATPTASSTATASPTATSTTTATSTVSAPTATPEASATATMTTSPIPTLPPSAPGEWNQHAYNAQHTSFNPDSVPTPWRWKWVWNGSTPSGGVVSDKSRLPVNSQPVTGAGRVFIAAGNRGVYALGNATGNELWNSRPGGNINSTPAFDPSSGALLVLSDNGNLYKLNAADGQVIGTFSTGESNSLPLPPALVGSRVFISMGSGVYAVDIQSMQQIWRYETGSVADTPPAYSPSRDLVIVASRDLYVHAIRNGDGAQAWRSKTSVLDPGDPGISANNNLAQVSRGWPVIAEGNGLVLVKLRLDWQTLWTWNPWPTTNGQMRTNLTGSPDQQALLVLNIDTGNTAFVANVGHGGYGDGDYMPMGPQPVVKRLDNGGEVAYVVMRAEPCLAEPCDGRWDSRLGEMMLNNSTVPGYAAGEVRFMTNSFFPTDEQAQLSMAGNDIFAGHWEAGIAHRIVDRSNNLGTADNPIQVTNLPHIVASQDQDQCNSGFLSSHYCGSGLYNTRTWPGGFYVYWNLSNIYDEYWSEYAMWTVSGDTVYFVGTDGSLVALENGNPEGVAVRTAPRPVETGEINVSQGTIPAAQARAYAGRTMTVDGEINEVFSNGKAVYLTYHKPHAGHFLVRILKKDWGNFVTSPLDTYTAGQRLRVTGEIEWYQGDPVIYAHAPDQIEIVADEIAFRGD
ncbi:MAG: PQQ-binding-like beta-propeller repeat protein [Caldilineaceae bacterium]